MYSFTDDYSEGVHPEILEAMTEENLNQRTGYGLGTHCIHAAELIRREVGRDDVDVHFLVGGTQTNLLVIPVALCPYQAVISTYTGHINVHETGAIEATGHKALTMESPDGKLSLALAQKTLGAYTDEHMAWFKLVYTSNSTETSTQYIKAKLEALHHICRQNQLYLSMDGARVGSALTSEVNDLTLADTASLVGVFYIGGTKNTALFDETLTICAEALKPDLRFMVKQRGTMLAKGWFLDIQFEELSQNNLFFETAVHVSEMTSRLGKVLIDHGYTFVSNSTTNQLSPVFPDPLVEQLSRIFTFSIDSKPGATYTVIRLATSWTITPESVGTFIRALD